MADLIIIGGAPGTGKTTIGEFLKEEKGFPCLDFGRLRQMHLDEMWSDSNEHEEMMALENLEFMIRNYLKNGYESVIVTDLKDERLGEVANRFKDKNVRIFSLFVTDDEELKRRVLGDRDSGFKDTEAAVEWNRKLINRKELPNEIKIDNTHNNPLETVKRILGLLKI